MFPIFIFSININLYILLHLLDFVVPTVTRGNDRKAERKGGDKTGEEGKRTEGQK